MVSALYSRSPCTGHSVSDTGRCHWKVSNLSSTAWLLQCLNTHLSEGSTYFYPILFTKELFDGNNRLEDFVTWQTFEKNKASLSHKKFFRSLHHCIIAASGREDEEGLLGWYRGTWILSHLFRNHTIQQPFLNIISTTLQISEWKK